MSFTCLKHNWHSLDLSCPLCIKITSGNTGVGNVVINTEDEPPIQQDIQEIYDPITDQVVLISPIQQQINADAATIKKLQEENSTLKKALVEINIGCKNILEENERLTLSLNLAEGRNRDLVEALESIAEGAVPINEQQAFSWIDTARRIATEALNK